MGEISKNNIPVSLRFWFVIHFVVDIIFAVPLIFFPVVFLKFFGFQEIGPFTARLVGAALVGIGGASFLLKDKSRETYQGMLTLKILWSGAAIVGISLSIAEGGPVSQWLFLLIFVSFSGLWIFYKVLISRE